VTCFSCRGRGIIGTRKCPDCDSATEAQVESHLLYTERRKAENAESRDGAEEHRQPWTYEEEQDLLDMWDEFPHKEVAEYLGRTIEACKQHRYEMIWGQRSSRNKIVRRYQKETREKEEYVPVPAGPDEDQWWAPNYYLRAVTT
jgi:hypothetical protein